MSPTREEGPRVTPFLTKTYQLVDDHGTNDVISWNSDGTSFVVWRPAEFARDILPLFFKHNNLSSFVRQLNTYGFRKISDRWEFINENFRRGEKRRLSEIRRRRRLSPNNAVVATEGDGSPTNSSEEHAASSDDSPPPVPSSSSGIATSSSSTHLEEENNRLRQENKRLSQELVRMKKICSNIFNLVSDHNSNHVHNGARTSAGHLQLLDLMPVDGISVHDDDEDEEGRSTRLFGVSIRTKRSKDGVRNGLNDDNNMDMDGETRKDDRGKGV